jgi:hypothetical protein
MRPIYHHRKQITINYEIEFLTNRMMKLENNNNKKKTQKNKSCQLRLTRQALFPGYGTRIT